MLLEEVNPESSNPKTTDLPESTPTTSPAAQGARSQSAQRSGALIVTLVLAFLAGLVGGVSALVWGGSVLSAWGVPSQVNPLLNLGSTFTRTLKVEEESATTEAVKKVSPSVVSIIISREVSQLYNRTGPLPFDSFDFPFNFFFGGLEPQQLQPPQGGQQVVGGGTGFVIDGARGLILTNRHVVSDTNAQYTVLTNDGKRLEARVVARDTVNDMALVEVADKNLPAVELGDSDSITIGQSVIAIGNALGEYRNTVTKGVISGTARNVIAGDNRGSSESLEGVFQTDAAINPGNSGGPLVNLAGQVIGINTAVSREGQLIGFAIPINEAKRMIQSYLEFGRIVRPYLGIRYSIVTPELARTNDLDVEYGALLVRGRNNEPAVVAGSPAAQAGLVENDIVLEVNGERIDQDHSLVKILAQFKPGDTVRLLVLHEGERKMVEVRLAEFKE